MAPKDLIARLMEIYSKTRFEQIARSHCFADKEERKGRLRAIMALSAELERIRAVNIFSTGLATGVIEDIIEGDWRSAMSLGLHFTFETEGEEIRAEYAGLWAKFVEILRVEGALAEQRARHEAPGRPD